ncbi:MAG: hypothetical protein JWO91_2029 [Acidobacteriaceae bacterium]|nr:hypothetical protein [Acidobacteriaceae bacterium]
MSNRQKLTVAFFSILTIGCAFAQSAPTSFPNETSDSGLYEYSAFSAGNDSSGGWSSEMDSTVGYDFTRHLGVSFGIPLYLLTTTTQTTLTGTQTTTSNYGSLGDLFLRLNASKGSAPMSYSTSLTGTAPTGDTSTGISTGRVTANWNNRIEHGFDVFTPFAEGSIGNSLGSTTRYHRAFTTLGAVSEFRGGAGFDFPKGLSFEGSFYDDVGYGGQKIYSHHVPKGASGLSGSKHNRPFDQNFLTQGAASLVSDHGLTADFSLNPSKRVDLDLSFNRSMTYADNSASFTIGYRLGHVGSKGDRK